MNRGFSLLTDYKERRDKKLLGTHLIPDTPTYHVTPTRPGNFGEHLDFKINIDNWFEENRYQPLRLEPITSIRPSLEGLISIY